MDRFEGGESANQQIYIRRSLEDWNELGSNK
jgi:hypothetical protein